MSLSACRKALSIPEILTAIASQTLLFDPTCTDCDLIYSGYQPHDVFSCILVSRLWHQCFLPQLYHFYIDHFLDMPHTPSDTHLASSYTERPSSILAFRKHAHLFRRYFSSSHETVNETQLPYDINAPPTQLLGLFVDNFSDQIGQLLIANSDFGSRSNSNLHSIAGCSQLQELKLTGNYRVQQIESPYREGLMSLPLLRELELENWICDNELLMGILTCCSGTLRRLSLISVGGFDSEIFGSEMVKKIQQKDDDSEDNDSEDDDDYANTFRRYTVAIVAPDILIPTLQLPRLTHLRLQLDWIQSRAAVLLPSWCPALESLELSVDMEEHDLAGMTTLLRNHCPRLASLAYTEGHSMAYEYGYFPDLKVYAALFRDCTTLISAGAAKREEEEGDERKQQEQWQHTDPQQPSQQQHFLKSIKAGLPRGIDDLMYGAIITHASQLETLILRCNHSTEHSDSTKFDMSKAGVIFASCPYLREVSLLIVDCSIDSFEALFQQPWACHHLSTLVIDGYTPGYEADENSDAQQRYEASRLLVRNNATPPLRDFEEYKEDGQGWFLERSLSPDEFSEAMADGAVKRRMLEHIHKTSGITNMEYFRLNDTGFYSQEQFLVA